MLDSYGPGIAERLHASPHLTRLPASLDPPPYAVTHRYHEPLRPGVLPDWWGGARNRSSTSPLAPWRARATASGRELIGALEPRS
ncbi:hypothetical protein ACFVYE_33915 [Streptomyces sp. NPDC058239]|uniref:hypothetical protein n=1 Tax=unclassified Streptomyces TaxID=2593676 RepID=UPI00364A5217